MVPMLTIGGRIAKGFDFLGYSFEPKGLSIAPKTLANFLEHIAQLYEQGADARRVGQYVRFVHAVQVFISHQEPLPLPPPVASM